MCRGFDSRVLGKFLSLGVFAHVKCPAIQGINFFVISDYITYWGSLKSKINNLKYWDVRFQSLFLLIFIIVGSHHTRHATPHQTLVDNAVMSINTSSGRYARKTKITYKYYYERIVDRFEGSLCHSELGTKINRMILIVGWETEFTHIKISSSPMVRTPRYLSLEETVRL